MQDFVISLYETEVVPDPCYCMCYFDVTTQIADLPSGSYTVDIYVEGEFRVSGDIDIP